VKIHELKKGQRFRVWEDGTVFVFNRSDGRYSYCTAVSGDSRGSPYCFINSPDDDDVFLETNLTTADSHRNIERAERLAGESPDKGKVCRGSFATSAVQLKIGHTPAGPQGTSAGGLERGHIGRAAGVAPILTEGAQSA